MKKLLCMLTMAMMLAAPAWSDVNIDSSTFPDANFRSYISTKYDTNSDGVLSDAELANVKAIDLHGMSTIKLTGIEIFKALKRLNCNFSLGSAGSYEFDYTSFKSAYGLTCDIDDSYFLMMHIDMGGADGLMTPMVGDVRDTTKSGYVLSLPLYNNQTLEGISFRTKGTMNIEVHVEP